MLPNSKFITVFLMTLCLFFQAYASTPAGNSPYRTRLTSTYDGLPSDNVQQVLQDSEGYMWFATHNGLARYDGARMTVFKSDIRSGEVLTNNNITCLAEDKLNRIWIGTQEGLNVFDKKRSAIRRIIRPELRSNTISCLLATRDGRIFVGSDQGLFEYLTDTDSLHLYTRERSGDVMPQTSVKSLMEDSRGNIWIGTWNEGLYRLSTDGAFHSYPRFNERKSAHVIFEDSRHRIWVGSWDCGLSMLRNPYDPEKVSWENYTHDTSDPTSISDNIIYSISEDPSTHTLWIGTRKGVSLLHESSTAFEHIYSDGNDNSVKEVTSIIHDRAGVMWISILGKGAMSFASKSTGLNLDRLDGIRERFGTNSVQRVSGDRQGRLWISLGANSGVAVYDMRDGSVSANPGHPFSAASATPYTTQCIIQASDGKMYVGTYDGGLYIISSDGKTMEHHTRSNTPWLAGDRVSAIYEDSSGRMWFGALPGLTVLMPDGTYCRFDSLFEEGISVNSIVEGADGCIWVGSKNLGVVRIDGYGTRPSAYSVKTYNPSGASLNSTAVTVLYCDISGRVWAGTSGAGLSLYDYTEDSFTPVHVKWNLPGDVISSILGDSASNLWIGSNMGLYRLRVSPDNSTASFKVFTSSDGAQDNIFSHNAAFRDYAGRMFFGGPHGLNIISGELTEDESCSLPVTITDIKVSGVSWERMSDDERDAVSQLAPGYTECIRLNPSQNNFSIEFMVLDFLNNPLQHKYAYRLDGFDSGWQYPDASRRFAYYNNLSPGEYTFRVMTSDAKGAWSGKERTLKVIVEPSLWATWWAKLIYLLISLAAIYILFRISRTRVRRSNELHLRELELEQAERLNRDKLRFFTNVTHEWLTPLSIISAVAEQMKGNTPEQKEYHRIMMNSVNRLSRLLQQVLEFRKAESGNLRLRVSEGDLVAMVGGIIENIMPVMKARGLECTFTHEAEQLKAWFDPDKIDKILYNLLTNAAKYVLPDGKVTIKLEYVPELSRAVISVADNGPGIPSQRIPDLFKRFYEGEHRRYSTSGNGIGLSLTKDLVELHHGAIEVESTEGVGTEFRVTIPILRTAYQENEIDNMPAMTLSTVSDSPQKNDTTTAEDTAVYEDRAVLPESDGKETLLVVEDDGDLLRLMSQLLSHDYTVLTAPSAESAMKTLAAHDINLIITDMMMPGMNGLDFCRQAKSRIESSHIPILLLTANAMEDAEVEAYKAGADGFIPKPFSFTVLQARISNLLSRRSTSNRNFREQFATDVDSYVYTSLDENFLKKSMELITAHISDPDYSQTMFAKDMAISKSTLFRKLKSLTGLSYSSFVRNIRLKTACRIMGEKKGIRISELAYAVGFNDPKYFSLCFKKEFGMLPSEYIERFVNKDTATDEQQ